MIKRLLAQRSRLALVCEADIEDRWVLGLEVHEQQYRTTVCLVLGTLRLGVAWRRV